MQPTNAVQGTSAPFSSVPSTQSNAAIQGPTEAQPASQNSVATPEPTSRSNEAPLSSSPASSASPIKSPVAPQRVPVTRDNTRGGSTTIPAAVTERISRTSPEPEPNKPGLGPVHLASPKMNRPAASQDEEESAPTLTNGAVVPSVGGLDSGLAESGGKQPAAPEVPLPVGGDVKTARLISQVAPVYPVMAKNQHVSGNVVIDALIDVNGRVTTMKVISGPALLHQAAKRRAPPMEVSAGIARWQTRSDAPDCHTAVPHAIVRSSASTAARRVSAGSHHLWALGIGTTCGTRISAAGRAGKSGVRFCLIPISYRIEVISTIVCMSMLDCRAQRLGKRNRGIQVEAIDGPSPALQFRANDRCSE